MKKKIDKFRTDQIYLGKFRDGKINLDIFRYFQTNKFRYIQIFLDIFRVVEIYLDKFRDGKISLDIFRYFQSSLNILR